MTIRWRSFELRPVGSPPIPEWYRQRILAARPQFEAIALEHYGVKINSGKFGINSRPSLIGAKFAEQQGKGEEYHKQVFQAYWQEAQSIEEISTLTAIAKSIYLDPDDFIVALESEELEALVLQDIAQAQAFGISGVPAIVLAEKFLVNGAQPYEELVKIVEQIQHRLLVG